MSKLIKYEFRKSLFSKLVFAGITAVMEIIYLIGILGNYNKPTVIGMIGLFFTALAGITFIGIESILILYRDLTTKQSYMLFMTPNNSYKILGAKALEMLFPFSFPAFSSASWLLWISGFCFVRTEASRI